MNTKDYILKKYDINVGRQHVVEIPNMGRDNLAELFSELGYKKGVELGVDLGEYSEVLCKANPKAKIYGVDPWMESAYEPDTYVNENQEFFDDRCKRATERLKPYKNYKVVRKTSLDALEDFEDNSLDFVYIDGNHDFPNVTRDIHGWRKKVRMGGILSGHDYAYFSYSKFNHVKRVILAYMRCYSLIPLFIAGAPTYDEGMVRDKYRSWFWVVDHE